VNADGVDVTMSSVRKRGESYQIEARRFQFGSFNLFHRFLSPYHALTPTRKPESFLSDSLLLEREIKLLSGGGYRSDGVSAVRKTTPERA